MLFSSVTESTPTLPCATKPVIFLPPPHRRTWPTTVLILALSTLCLVLLFGRGKAPPTLEEQIRLRIATDKALAGSAILVSADGTGHVTLQGSVTNPHQKQKAVQLAEQTAGVEAVKDELALK